MSFITNQERKKSINKGMHIIKISGEKIIKHAVDQWVMNG